jgi:hypothetical protein
VGLFTDAAPRLPSPALTLAPGQVYLPPQGWYWYKAGRSTCVQRYDPVMLMWRTAGSDSLESMNMLYFDGATNRIANTSGCAVGAIVTTAGSGYTNSAPPAVTASAGGSKWQAIVGGAVSTLAVINSGGTGYLYPPVLWIEQPPEPGIQAAGVCTINTLGVITTITITEQGAGYIFPPNVAILNDWRDLVGYGGNASVTLTGGGTVTGVVCLDHGNPITSGTVPTLSFGSGAAAATAIMDWGVTSVSISAAGSGFGNSGFVTAGAAGGYVTSTPAYVGGSSSIGETRWREAIVDIATSGSGALQAPIAIIDPGHYQSVPYAVITAAAAPGSLATLSLIMGGTNSTIFLMPAQK